MKRFCVIGEHLGHSLSAVIHTRLFALLGMEGAYDVREMPPAAARTAVADLAAAGYDGFNITIPYKILMAPQLDRLSDAAAAIGAVNTVDLRRRAGTLTATGYNTDHAGFGYLLRRAGIDPAGRPAAVLGVGGAFRAVAARLLEQGVTRLYAVSRQPGRAPLPADPRVEAIGYDRLRQLEGGLLVNTTPVGMFPHAGVSPVEDALVARWGAAVDLIYNPRRTAFLQAADRAGIPAADGLPMLVAQAVAAEEIWLDRPIAPALTEQIVTELDRTFQE